MNKKSQNLVKNIMGLKTSMIILTKEFMITRINLTLFTIHL